MAARTHLAEHNGDPYRTSQRKATKEAKGPLWIPILEVWSDEAGPSTSCRERPGTQFHDRSRRKRTHPKPANLSPHGKLGLLIQYEAGPDVGEDIKRETSKFAGDTGLWPKLDERRLSASEGGADLPLRQR